jgi:hypothetical protein
MNPPIQSDPVAQYAQDSSRRYSVDLRVDEQRGGHTIRDHVGKSDEELLGRVRPDRGRIGIFSYAQQRHGSFESLETANDLVNRVLEKNKGMVDLVASGRTDSAFLVERFGYKTGREAFRPTINSEPYLRDAYEVGVLVVHDQNSLRGYRVHTAYPRNSSPR